IDPNRHSGPTPWTLRPRRTIIKCRRPEETWMDVGVWLRGLGLEQYEALFRENDIDAEVLSDLTDGDLEKIGVSLGHRKRLLKAIAVLAGPAAAPPAAATPI